MSFPKKLKVGMRFKLNKNTDKSNWEFPEEDIEEYLKKKTFFLIECNGNPYSVVLDDNKNGKGNWLMNRNFLKKHFLHIPDKITNWKQIIKR